MLTLALAHALVPGSTLVGDGATALARVHTDTRTVEPGDCFVALRGERFDGHDFLAAARAAGAVAAIAERGLAEAGLPGLIVPGALAALQQLAAGWRARHEVELVAVTGSNGKTTVTQMIGAILRAWIGEAALTTRGNLNNHIGVPLTLLRLRQDRAVWHRAAVVELGMNHPGEIAQLAALAAPTVALVNNAQREHQEFMADVAAVAAENGAVIDALGATGVAVFPADDPYALLWRARAGSRPLLSFATGAVPAGAPAADLGVDALWVDDHWALVLHTPAGAVSTRLHMPGRHNVHNALAACACALAVGAPLAALQAGLERFRAVAGRSALTHVTRRGEALTLVDDSYNANPDSVRAAIDVLASLPAPHALVLGDMGEVGAQGAAFHAEVGAYARERGIETLWSVGSLAAHAGAQRHFEGVEALVAALPELPHAASLLVKGSRFMRMERVVRALAGEPL